MDRLFPKVNQILNLKFAWKECGGLSLEARLLIIIIILTCHGSDGWARSAFLKCKGLIDLLIIYHI